MFLLVKNKIICNVSKIIIQYFPLVLILQKNYVHLAKQNKISIKMNLVKLSVIMFLMVFSFSCTKSIKTKSSEAILIGNYLGQESPNNSAVIFADGIVSTEFNERDMTFSPNGNECFYSLKGASTYSIIHIIRVNNIWQKPEVAAFSGIYSDIEPCFSPDGKKLYFASNRPILENGEVKDYDIWFVEMTDSGWANPQNIGTPISTEANEFYPSFTNDGTIYFCARNNKSIGGEDLFYSELIDGKYQEPKNLGDSINTVRDEFNAFVEPNGKYIIFTSTGWGQGFGGGDLWISFRKENNEWQKPMNMGENVNSEYFEYCPSLSPDGKYLFFTSNKLSTIKNSNKKLTYKKIVEDLHSTLNGSQNIYWINKDFIQSLNK